MEASEVRVVHVRQTAQLTDLGLTSLLTSLQRVEFHLGHVHRQLVAVLHQPHLLTDVRATLCARTRSSLIESAEDLLGNGRTKRTDVAGTLLVHVGARSLAGVTQPGSRHLVGLGHAATKLTKKTLERAEVTLTSPFTVAHEAGIAKTAEHLVGLTLGLLVQSADLANSSPVRGGVIAKSGVRLLTILVHPANGRINLALKALILVHPLHLGASECPDDSTEI